MFGYYLWHVIIFWKSIFVIENAFYRLHTISFKIIFLHVYACILWSINEHKTGLMHLEQSSCWQTLLLKREITHQSSLELDANLCVNIFRKFETGLCQMNRWLNPLMIRISKWLWKHVLWPNVFCKIEKRHC